MIWRIDAFLIDRLFQPCADHLARWASCYAAAAFLTTGATAIYIAACCADTDWLALGYNLPWFCFVTWRSYSLETRARSTTLPIDRVRFFGVRVAWLLLRLPGMAIVVTTHDLSFAIREASWCLLVAALYFMACRPNPPKPRTAPRQLIAVQTT